jgi:hypothetical protein
MQRYRGLEVLHCALLTSAGTKWTACLASRSGLFVYEERTQVPVEANLDWTKSFSGTCGEDKNLALPEIECPVSNSRHCPKSLMHLVFST